MKKFNDYVTEGKNPTIEDIIEEVEDTLDYSIGFNANSLVLKEYIYEIDKKGIFIGSSDAEYSEKEFKTAFERNKGVVVLNLKFKSYMKDDEAFIDVKMRIQVQVD